MFTLLLIAASYPIYLLAVKKTTTRDSAIDRSAVAEAQAD
jgi:hypothetical protein